MRSDLLSALASTTGAKRWLARSRLPKPNAIYPRTLDPKATPGPENYVYSMDADFLRYKEYVRQKCNAEFPLDVLPSGFAGPTGVPGDFNALTSVSGVGMDPLPIPLVSNAAFIKSNGLADALKESDRPFLREMVRLFFGAAAPADLYIRKAGSTSFPFFTTDNDYKKLAALKILHNPDHFLRLATGSEAQLREMADTYHTVLLYAIHERQQPDGTTTENGKLVPKKRVAATEEEARTGSYTGKTFANKEVKDVHGNVLENNFAMRRRDVFGMSGPVNYFLTAIMGCFREVYLDRFAFTYKVRGREDKQEKISSYSFVVGSDVKTMDKTIPEWFLTEVLAELSNYLDPRVIELMRRAYQSPYVVPSPWRETPEQFDPLFGGSPFDPKNFKQHVGLPSGVAFNPDWGKLWMTFVYMVLYRDCGAIHSPSEVEGLLQGKNRDHAILDMSDDAAFLTNSPSVAAKFKVAKSPYALLEPEVPVIYLGDVFCQVGDRKMVYPNPITYVVNPVCREDSIDRSGPVAWAEGFVARQQVYSFSPIYRDLHNIMDMAARKFLGLSPALMARTMAGMQRFSDADALVLANAAVLHYKVDPKDVSPEVLDSAVAKIPASDFFNKIRHLFLVPTKELQNDKAH